MTHTTNIDGARAMMAAPHQRFSFLLVNESGDTSRISSNAVVVLADNLVRDP